MASRFWVLGTGTWDGSNIVNWAASTGGVGGQSVPGSGDTVTFDGNSGGGTVTVNGTVNVTSITMGLFTGTLDFSANNNDVTIQTYSNSGSSTRAINLGNGTWTVTGTGNLWNHSTVTGLTFNANSSTINLSATTNLTRTFSPNAVTLNTLSIAANTGSGTVAIGTNTLTTTIATLNISAPNNVTIAGNAVLPITNAFNFAGTSTQPISLVGATVGTQPTLSISSGSPTIAWGVLRDILCSGGATFTATNSLNLGNNSGITITAPNVSGGGTTFVIGG